MKYSTRYYGAPYGIAGERGDDTSRPKSLAQSVLNPGQRMDCFALSDTGQKKPLRRFRRGVNSYLPAEEVNI